MESLRFRLLNEFQRNFPLTSRPYAELGARLGVDEASVIATLSQLVGEGVVSRVGAVFAPRRIGASTLAALAVPEDELERVAEAVSRRPEVNHNYRREHRFNLWFVMTAADDLMLARVLAEIADDAHCRLLSVPLLEEYHIDLGFDLAGVCKAASRPRLIGNDRVILSTAQQHLMAALQDGLPLVRRPYRDIASRAGCDEEAVLGQLRRWEEQGIVKRFGVVVRHHELGYTANAMAVWDVPDDEAAALGRRLAAEPLVTLCYRRQRHLPAWPYNLFCMIHGRARAEVEQAIVDLTARLGLRRYDSAVLFSTRRYKQRGARYVAAHSGVV